MDAAETHDSPTPAEPICQCAAQIANLETRLAKIEAEWEAAKRQPRDLEGIAREMLKPYPPLSPAEASAP